jgi:diguanylate cyclase (GGDEF)-like protein/PAS domain S-box-containing protein
MGFALLLALMLALLLTGLSRMYTMNQGLQAIVENHSLKMDLVWAMRHAARERAVLLHQILHATDPFARDELVQRFNLMARDFIAARQRLESTRLDATERDILRDAFAFARRGELAQQTIIDRLLGGETHDLQHHAVDEVVDIQNHVLGHLNRLVAYEQQASQAARQAASDAYRSAIGLMLGIGGLFLLAGGMVARYVIRRSTRIERALQSEKDRAEVTLHSIGDAVVTTDELGRVTYLNPIAERLAGWRHAEAVGQPLARVLDLRGGERNLPLLTGFNPATGDQTALRGQVAGELAARDGQRYFIELTTNLIRRQADGATEGAVLVLRDVSQARELSRQLSWAATHDALTGLINRTEFERRLHALLEDARASGREHALLYLDLDQFKVVNDTCGHAAGDELLRQITHHLGEHVRSSDTLARLGGDEFGVLLDGCPLAKAAAIAENLRDTVAQFRFMWQDKPFDVGVSIGLAPITALSEDAHALLSAVDAACYVAKDKGRNLVHVYEPNDQETARRRGEMEWSQQLSQAIKEDRLLLHAQRIVPLGNRPYAVEHMELMIRMTDTSGRIVPPMSFIPAAERYGLMTALDRWVIQKVFQRLAGSPQQSRHALCAINLSGQSLGDAGMLQYIVDAFASTGVSPTRICFEITETAAVANLRAATRFIQRLREMGCSFSLDDFGSGMSSFGYLRQLRVDYLKIDGAFVRDIVNDPTDYALVQAINNIGHVMGLKTIAECVENDAIAKLLEHIGVDYVQGYGVHRPEPLDQLSAPPALRAAGA